MPNPLIITPAKDETPQTKFTVKDNSASLMMVTPERIKTLEQLIKVAEIDTDVWEVVHFTCNKWEVAAYSKKQDTFKTSDLWQVKATFKKRSGVLQMRAIAKAILDEIKSAVPVEKKLPREKKKDGMLAEVDLFDAHIGQLVWGMETGRGNYDLQIAEKNYLSAIQTMIERLSPYNIERILFPIGNDFFNVNGSSGTTFNDTPQHEDARWQKTFRVGVRLLRQSVAMLSKVAPVSIVVVTGNHDTEPIFYAGEILSAIYENNPNVSVDDAPTQRKYFRYGKCLIGFTHGKYEKHGELPLIMANERKDDWKETQFREWHLGHLHHEKEYRFLSSQEFKGVTVRIIRALTETDVWHTSRGYIGSLRAAECFVWDKNHGMVCNLSVNV